MRQFVGLLFIQLPYIISLISSFDNYNNIGKERRMKNWIIFVISVLFFITGTVYAKDYEIAKKADNYNVEVKIDKNPPVVGDNNIEIKIKEADKYITDAKVVVEYSMPAMPGMPAMNYKTDTKLDGYEYKAKMNLSMAGSWNITVKIERGGKTSKVKLNIDAR